MGEDDKKPLADQMFEDCVNDSSHSKDLVAQVLLQRPGFDITADIKGHFTDRKVVDMTPATASALIESARLTHAVPAEQRTKQAEEKTKQEAEETKRAVEVTKRSVHETIKSSYPLVGVVTGLVAMALVPEHAREIAVVVGVLQIPTVVEKVSDSITKGRKGTGGEK